MIAREQIERWRRAGKVLHIEDWHAVLNLAAQALDQGADARLGAAVRATLYPTKWEGSTDEYAKDMELLGLDQAADVFRAIAHVLREEEAEKDAAIRQKNAEIIRKAAERARARR